MSHFLRNELRTKLKKPHCMCNVIVISLHHNYIIIYIFRILKCLSNDITSVLVWNRWVYLYGRRDKESRINIEILDT